MRDRDAYNRNKAKYETYRKKPFIQRWQVRLGNADRITQILLVAFTFSIAGVGLLQWCAITNSVDVMQGQLTEMQTEAAIRRQELKANLQLTLDRLILPNKWQVTPRWENVGKSDALNVRGWSNLKVTMTPEELKTANFFDIPSGTKMGQKRTLIPTDKILFKSEVMTAADVQKFADQLAGPVVYGYIEYTDIFKTFYTVHFCQFLNFERNETGGINWTSPVTLPLPCESRTEIKRTQ